MLGSFTLGVIGGPGDWWLVSSPERIMYGGLAQSGFVNNSSLSGSATPGGRTFISNDPANRIRQHGLIRRVVLSVYAAGGANSWKFKVFRPNGDSFDFVGESELVTIGSTGLQTVNLATPISAQMGDVCGVWIKEGNPLIQINCKAGGSALYTAGDITGSNSFSNSVAFTMNMEFRGSPPFLTITGDSIAEGHNAGDSWHSHMHTGLGIGGQIDSSVGQKLRGLIGNTFEYQNHALGSQTFAWVAATGTPSAVATKARAILIHCGVNDVATGRTWAAVEGNLNTIKGLLTTGQRLFVGEILPWTAGNDSQAATIRTWNANLATWCSANNARLVLCHDAMGQVRVSTGQLDDLQASYNQDGIHLSQAGVDALAALWRIALEANY